MRAKRNLFSKPPWLEDGWVSWADRKYCGPALMGRVHYGDEVSKGPMGKEGLCGVR